jgi:hypothetical protein
MPQPGLKVSSYTFRSNGILTSRSHNRDSAPFSKVAPVPSLSPAGAPLLCRHCVHGLHGYERVCTAVFEPES